MTLDLERAARKHLGNHGGREYFLILTVATKDNAPVTDLEWENVIPGNFSKLSMVVKGMNILLKCIYAPNEDYTKRS